MKDSTFFSIGESLGVSWFRLYLADSLAARFPPDHRELARWLVLHMAVQAGSGHIRTGLNHLEGEMAEWYNLSAADAGKPEYEPGLPARLAHGLPVILEAALECGILGRLENSEERADDLRVPRPPLVLTPDGQWAYFLKRRREEDSLLAALSRRAAAGSTPTSSPAPKDAAEAIVRKIDEGRKLILLAGGPGTGKTTTVARLLRLLDSAEKRENRRLDTVLAAPTGRAAARMSESLSRDGNGSPTLRGRTIHSLLGLAPGRPAQFSPENPIPAELVIVDEASMVDLSLMNRLLAALPESAALILVGDPDQLPSVEAGALLGDLLKGDARAEEDGRRGPLNGAVVKLSQVYRSDTGILDAASAIRDGDFDALMKQLFDEAVPAVGLRSPGTPDSMARIISSVYLDSLTGTGQDLDGRINAGAGRNPATAVLTPLRRGPWGVPAMNDRISCLIGGSVGAFPGMPVMVTGNDRQRNLWNGDRGRVVTLGDRLRVVLDGTEGEREFPMAVLPGWEPAWIQTIHKSQGSEFDTVVVLLPPGSSGITTRELLYTAFTRAKHRVLLYADPETVKAALDRQVRRHSRIQDWAAG